MGYVHDVVINNVGEVVCGEPVSFANDKVFFRFRLFISLIHEILHNCGGFAAFESHGVAIPLRSAILGLLRRDGKTGPGIYGG